MRGEGAQGGRVYKGASLAAPSLRPLTLKVLKPQFTMNFLKGQLPVALFYVVAVAAVPQGGLPLGQPCA
jgi:hypothetical protein